MVIKSEIVKLLKQQVEQQQKEIDIKNKQIEELNETKYAITNINIYSSLDETSEIISSYSYNDSITIIGQYEDWYKVSYNEQIGYIKNEYISNSSLYL